MLFEVKRAQRLCCIDGQDFLGRFAGIDGKENGNQSAHDVRITVTDERETATAMHCRGKPNLANAAFHFGAGVPFSIGQRVQLPPELDHVAVAILPIVEQLEVGEDLVE